MSDRIANQWTVLKEERRASERNASVGRPCVIFMQTPLTVPRNAE